MGASVLHALCCLLSSVPWKMHISSCSGQGDRSSQSDPRHIATRAGQRADGDLEIVWSDFLVWENFVLRV